MTQPSRRPSFYTPRTKVLIVVVLVLAAAGFTLAVLTTADPDETDVAVTGDGEDGQQGFGAERVIVERYLPGRGVESVNQQSVGIDLAAGWTVLSFELNGVEVPVDQLDVSNELATYTYLPGGGKAVTEYRPGTNCASAIVSPLGEDVQGDTRTERWCFEVL